MTLKQILGKSERRGFLDGQMLVAMPGMQDERFIRTVIYVCAHSSDGAMGLVINKRAPNLGIQDLMVQLKLISQDAGILLPPAVDAIQVLSGGPVEKSRGFVLHSNDFFIESSSLPVDDGIAMTITMDILKAIAAGRGPERALVALGYAGWGPGQLDREMQENGWLHCPPDLSLIFDKEHETKYERAMRRIGIDPRMLSSEAGHA
ncbi:MAG TPA: YqgE/AlgH family protein [Beijerinckiaceae bacterium]|nr:YqgE/AlgH family protein [Beijerinckiaceae bacterium]